MNDPIEVVATIQPTISHNALIIISELEIAGMAVGALGDGKVSGTARPDALDTLRRVTGVTMVEQGTLPDDDPDGGMEWFNNLSTPQGMADLMEEMEAGYIAGMCTVCKSKRGMPHDQPRHDQYEAMTAKLRSGISLGYTDGTEEVVKLGDDGVIHLACAIPSCSALLIDGQWVGCMRGLDSPCSELTQSGTR